MEPAPYLCGYGYYARRPSKRNRELSYPPSPNWRVVTKAGRDAILRPLPSARSLGEATDRARQSGLQTAGLAWGWPRRLPVSDGLSVSGFDSPAQDIGRKSSGFPRYPLEKAIPVNWCCEGYVRQTESAAGRCFTANVENAT
jgi:hypothetical protein